MNYLTGQESLLIDAAINEITSAVVTNESILLEKIQSLHNFTPHHSSEYILEIINLRIKSTTPRKHQPGK